MMMMMGGVGEGIGTSKGRQWSGDGSDGRDLVTKVKLNGHKIELERLALGSADGGGKGFNSFGDCGGAREDGSNGLLIRDGFGHYFILLITI